MRYPTIRTRSALHFAVCYEIADNGFSTEQARLLFEHIKKESEGSAINAIEKTIALLEYLTGKGCLDFDYVYSQFTGNCFEVFNADGFRDYLFEHDESDCIDIYDWNDTKYLRELTDNRTLAEETARLWKYDYQEIDGIFFIWHT